MTEPFFDPFTHQKAEMRRRLRFRRRHYVANLDQMAAMTAFRAPPAPLSAICDGRAIIGGYAPNGDEANILPLLGALTADKVIALPFHDRRSTPMYFRVWKSGEMLQAGPWGTSQPAGTAPIVAPDILLVPLVGFDRNGGRLGQGGGHYDRYFADHPAALRVGIGWSVQEVDEIPISAHDRPMDAILTEQEWIVTGNRL